MYRDLNFTSALTSIIAGDLLKSFGEMMLHLCV